MRPGLMMVAAALAGSVALATGLPPDELAGFSAVTWNVQQPSAKTLGRQATFLARTGVDVIALQEVYRGSMSRWRAALGAASGREWHGRYAPQVRRSDGARGEGIAIFSTLPIVESESLLMPSTDRWTSARPALRVRVVLPADGRPVDVVTTHLSAGEDAGGSRARQVDELARWIAREATRWVLGGDLNEEPAAVTRFTPPGVLWRVPGDASDTTWPVERPARRIDYWVVPARGTSLQARATSVLDVCRGFATCLSDHRPVRAAFAAIR